MMVMMMMVDPDDAINDDDQSDDNDVGYKPDDRPLLFTVLWFMRVICRR